MHGFIGLVVAIVMLAIAIPVHSQNKPLLAVMDIRDRTGALSAEVIDNLTEYLRGLLAESGKYTVIDRSRQAKAIKDVLQKEREETHKACYERSCQVPVGRILAADQVLVTTFMKVGSQFMLKAEILRLDTEASSSGAVAKGAFGPEQGIEDRVVEALDTVIRKMVKQAPQGEKSEGGRSGLSAAGHEPAHESTQQVQNVRRNPEVGVPQIRGSTSERFFTCHASSEGPSAVGWCYRGSFYGIAHLGSIAYARTDRDVWGLAQVGGFTSVGGTFVGVAQVSLSYNKTNTFKGLASVAPYNKIDHFRGLVQGGVYNRNKSFKGVVQCLGYALPAGVNWVEQDFAGLLQAGLYNHVGGRMYGIQGGGVNRAGKVYGLQVAIYNKAEELRGLQIGIVNYAKVLRGLQVGLVNIAKQGGLPYMLILNVGF